MTLSTYNLYFLQANITAIVLMLFVLIVYVKEKKAAEAMAFKSVIFVIIIYCLSDIVAAVCKSMTFPGVRIVLLIANTLYIAVPVALVLVWEWYADLRLEPLGYKRTKLGNFFTVLLIIVLTLSLSSPFTHISFYLDENNVYHRAIGAYLVPLFSILYLLYTTIKIAQIHIKSDSRRARITASPLLLFIFPPIVTFIIQSLIYGITFNGFGFAFSVLLVYVIDQKNRITKDDLTRLNNRQEYENYIDNIYKNTKNLLICIIDINNFKYINNNYSKLEGDKAIIEISTLISNACKRTPSFMFISRYAGDKFVIVAKDPSNLLGSSLQKSLESEFEYRNHMARYSYKIIPSIGYAQGEINSQEDVSKLFHDADVAMLDAKYGKTN